MAFTGASKACVSISPLTDSRLCSPRTPRTVMSALTASAITRAPVGTRSVRRASSPSDLYLPRSRCTSMRTCRSEASYSSWSFGLSSTATRSTSFRSQAVISIVPCTFVTSTVASGATFAFLFVVCWAVAAGAAAARIAAASSAFGMFISGSPREAVTRGDDG